MMSPILGKCITCGAFITEDSQKHRSATNPENFHTGLLCGKASCSRAQNRKLKKDGHASFRASIKNMTEVERTRALKEIAHQAKDTEGYLRKQKEKAELLKKLLEAIEAGNKAEFKRYFKDLDNLLTSIHDTEYRNKIVDYFTEKLHKKLCLRHKISNEFNGKAELDPSKVLYNEIERKIISFISQGTGVPRIDISHPCYDWLY